MFWIRASVQTRRFSSLWSYSGGRGGGGGGGEKSAADTVNPHCSRIFMLIWDPVQDWTSNIRLYARDGLFLVTAENNQSDESLVSCLSEATLSIPPFMYVFFLQMYPLQKPKHSWKRSIFILFMHFRLFRWLKFHKFAEGACLHTLPPPLPPSLPPHFRTCSAAPAGACNATLTKGLDQKSME